jgi:hypothetical protein
MDLFHSVEGADQADNMLCNNANIFHVCCMIEHGVSWPSAVAT